MGLFPFNFSVFEIQRFYTQVIQKFNSKKLLTHIFFFLDTRTVKKQLIELGLPTSLGPQKISRKREDFVQNTNNEKSVAPNTYLLKRT